eukprot:Phypoly_transcript_03151.p1 GENE.Phypoly_transcript_03151~~Phypoly_transcript_03151.p1  ORF type:complete len:727 (+),score=161.57 Phypoly_transcript_03151:83-2263(+)
MALPDAGSGMNGTINGAEDTTVIVEREKIIEQLANENQLLVWKVSELEDTIDGLKLKNETLEEKVAALTRANNELREQLGAPKENTSEHTAYEPEITEGGEEIQENQEVQEAQEVPEITEEPRKKRPSCPPPPIPPLQSARSPSPSVSPQSSPTGLPSDEAWANMPPGAKGWSSATVGRRDSGAYTSELRKNSRATAPLNHSSSLTSLPMMIAEGKGYDTVREERSKTSPIPAPSPSLVPPYLARAISLSSPALPAAETDLSQGTPPMRGSMLDLCADSQEPEEEESEDLILAKNEETGKTFIKGGTLDKLVERLTYDRTPETDYAIAFLLTYRSFTTPMELLEKLIARYNIEPKEPLTGDQLALFEKKKKIIQLRVGNVLKMWLDKHFHDFQNDGNLVHRVINFVETQITKDMETIGKTITKLLAHQRGVLSFSFNTPPPTTFVPKSADFSDFEPVEVARQLTLIEYDLYRGIEAKECLNQAWGKPNKEELAPHIVLMIKRFNLVSAWVATEILRSDKLVDRILKVKKFLNIAKHCRDIENFNGVMEILAGLQNAAVHRLKKTWDKVLSKAKYEELNKSLLSLMSSNNNFTVYRAALHSCHPPCIPYLGVFLTDLTFIEDGTKDTLNGRDDLIHFEKRRKVSMVIRDIQQYQQTPYHFNLEPTIKEALITLQSQDEDTLYKQSMTSEPRDAKDTPTKREFSLSIPAFLVTFKDDIKNRKDDMLKK